MAIFVRNRRLKRCLGILLSLIFVFLVITITAGVFYGVERNKENTLIQSVCLVVDARLLRDTCGREDPTTTTTSSPYTTKTSGPYTTTTKFLYATDYSQTMPLARNKNLKEYYICYQPVWTVEYSTTKDTTYGDRKRTLIKGAYWEDYFGAIDELNKHPINSRQTCYIDKRPNQNIAQWTKPNSKPFLISLLIGASLFVGTVILTIAIVAYAWFMNKVNKRDQITETTPLKQFS